ncbi:MAG: S-layer homology domain-containing protein [Firmicutes bacterium]|nr:S-layer homology domain-containing protein [Bacillota bacterium]
MKAGKKILSVLLAAVLSLSLFIPAFAAEEDIVIFYTNDIHTYINNAVSDKDGLTYSKVAALKKSHEGSILVDAGDHIQGTAYGEMDNGATIVELMNAAGYDLATFGNHEFDYSVDTLKELIEAAEYDYVSCNVCYDNGEGTCEIIADKSFAMYEANGKKLAFVGITTPETITSSTPTYFQDEEGNFVYDFHRDDLYEKVQESIDEAKAQGADYIIALGHLGVDLSSVPWTSREVIANTEGFDAFIDGHSHTTMEAELVKDKNGDEVVLTQTGYYLNAVGKMTVSDEGITTELLTAEDFADIVPDPEVKAIEDAWMAEIDEQLGEIIGFSEVTFDNYDADGNRLVRKQSTNSGDLSADALYYLFDEMGMDVDVAVMNGGGIRNGATTGELSYYTCKDILPFGNVACLLTITGRQLLDALEWGVSELTANGAVEAGSFLHVSGAKFTLDLTVDSTVQADENGMWTGGPTGEYRVRDVMILNGETGEYEPLDLEAKYNLAGYNYTLRDLGGGFNMFEGSVNVLDYVAEDYMVLANYIKSFPVNEETGLPTIGADSIYSDVYGSGRITIKTTADADAPEVPETPEVPAENETVFKDVAKSDWFADAVDFVYENGIMSGVTEDTFGPKENTSRAMIAAILYRAEGSPAPVNKEGFDDVADGQYYTDAVSWALENKIMVGYNAKSFGPNDPVKREQLAATLWRYAQYKEMDVSAGENTNILSYNDADKISEYAIPAVQWACGAGIMSGSSGNLDPAGNSQRAHTAQMLMQLMDKPAA